MKRKISIQAVTVLILSVVLLSGIALAESIEIPVSGTQTTTNVDPGIQFTDDDGILHYRGLVQIAQLVGQDIDGVPVTGVGHYVLNINIDMATGNGDISMKLSTEMTYGDLVGAWRGSADLTITGFVYNGPFNYSRGSGDFARWHMRGTATGVFGTTDGVWDGYFHIPGGDKAAATEASTLSAVKSLYR